MLSTRLKIILVLTLTAMPLLWVSVWQWDVIRAHPIASAIGGLVYGMIMIALAFVGKVWKELEGSWVKSVAEWVDREIRLRVPRYHRRYCTHLGNKCRPYLDKDIPRPPFTPDLEKVFIDLNLYPEVPTRIPAALLENSYFGEKKDIWELLSSNIEAYKTLAIIGPPGSGKTTLLKHLAVCFAENKQRRYNSRVRAYLPIFLPLRDHKDRIASDMAPSLAQLAATQEKDPPTKWLPPTPWFERNLERKKCLVLLDGLDEVADEIQRAKVIEWVERQIIAYGGNRFIITSRPYGYVTMPLSNATVLGVRQFSDDQVRSFIVNWYRANEILSFGRDDGGVRAMADEGAADLLRRLKNAPKLYELAHNPLLLTMIAIVHRYENKLPDHRAELYDKICEVLLRRRLSPEVASSRMTVKQRLLVLQSLALSMMKNRWSTIKTNDAVDAIYTTLERVGRTGPDDPINFLQEVEQRSSLLVEPKRDQFAFAHLTFQEYLASVQLKEEPDDTLLRQVVNDSWWHETLRLYAAQTDASAIIRSCLTALADPIAALTLAYEISLEARDMDPDVRKELNKKLLAGLESLDLDHQHLAAEVILSRRLSHLTRISNTVEIDSSYISCAEYQLFIDEKRKQGEYHQPDHWTSHTFPSGLGRKAIIGIRPSDARAFCAWLTKRDRSRSGLRYRLPTPTEAEDNPIERRVGQDNQSPLDISALGTWCEAQPPIIAGISKQSAGQLEVIRDAVFNLVRELAANIDWILAAQLERALTPSLDRAIEDSRPRWHNLELDCDSLLDRDICTVIEHDSNFIRTLATNLSLPRRRLPEPDLAHARQLEIEAKQTLERELEQANKMVDLAARSRAIAEARMRFKEVTETRLRDHERAIERAATLDFALDLLNSMVNSLIRGSTLDLNRYLDRELLRVPDRSSYFRSLAILFLLYTAYLQDRIDRGKFPLEWLVKKRRKMLDAKIRTTRDKSLDMCMSLLILIERIQGNFPAWEGIRIVRERIATMDEALM